MPWLPLSQTVSPYVQERAFFRMKAEERAREQDRVRAEASCALCALRCAVLRHIPCEAHALRCDSHVSCHSLSIAMHMHWGVDDGQAGGPS